MLQKSTEKGVKDMILLFVGEICCVSDVNTPLDGISIMLINVSIRIVQTAVLSHLFVSSVLLKL